MSQGRCEKRREASRRVSKGNIIILCVAVAVFAIVFSVYSLWIPKRYGEEVGFACRRYGVSENLIFAVVKTESGFDKTAVSAKGAAGLMQVMPTTAKFVAEKYGEKTEDLYDPKYNVCCGTAYLAYLKDKFGDEKVAIAAYNAGEGNVVKWLKDKRYSSDGKTLYEIPFAETRGYVKKVLRLKRCYDVFYRPFS